MKIRKIAKQYWFVFIVLGAYFCYKTTYRHVIIQNPNLTNTDHLQNIKSTCPTLNLGLSEYAKTVCSEEIEQVCEMITCQRLLQKTDNKTWYKSIRRGMLDNPRKKLNDSYYKVATSNCEKYKKDRGYILHPMSQEEESFPIAFTLLAHTNAEQVERLLRAIYRPQNLYCIHVDAKASSSFIEAIRSISECFDNVFLASRLEAIVYYGYSRLQADINCMNDLVNHSIQWRYLINTAAQAYPVRTVLEMVKILKIYNGSNDIEGIFGSRVLTFRFNLEWEEVLESDTVQMTGKLNHRPPHDIDIVRGSAYGIFSRKFVEFVLGDRRAIDLLIWSKKTLTPDEHYWATLHHTYSNPHLRTPGGYNGHPNDKPWLAVFAEWDETKCHGQMPHSVCVFGVEDLSNLIERKEFFVNKFNIDFEPLALDCFEAWLQQKTICPETLDEEFYRKLPFITR